MAAAVALTSFVALVASRLGQLLRFGFQQPIQCFLDAAADSFFQLPLDYFFVKLYNFLRHGLLSPFRMVCRNFILTESANRVFLFFNFAQLIVPDPWESDDLRSALEQVHYINYERPVRKLKGKPPVPYRTELVAKKLCVYYLLTTSDLGSGRFL